MDRRLVRLGVIALSIAVTMLVFTVSPALAQHGGRTSRGSSSRGASAQRSSPAVRGPAASMGVRPTSAAIAQRSRPIGRPPTGIAAARSRSPLMDGRRVAASRPYYAFRPRFSLGFGLSVGYPVAFPYGYNSYYYNPYIYNGNYGAGYGPVYGSGYDGSYYGSSYGGAYYGPGYGATGGSSYGRSGGLSFDITPSDAALFIDGKYVGAVEDFAPTEAPLTLSTGRHHADVRAQGYQTMSFDISVVAGQVIPYQGTLTLVR